jgi:integrase
MVQAIKPQHHSEPEGAKSKRKKETRDPDGSVIKKIETINGKKTTVWYVRKRFYDSQGKVREKKRRTTSFADVSLLRQQIAQEIVDEGKRALQPVAETITFKEYADWYKEKYLVAPRYIGDRKVAGLESWKRERNFVEHLVAAFGHLTLPEITYARIEGYKEARLKEAAHRIAEARRHVEERNAKIKKKKLAKIKKLSERFIAQTNLTAVNRELQRLRAMLNKAIPKYLSSNPFKDGDPLIAVSQEGMRERILRRYEEPLLLAQCAGARAHLYAAAIFALDTAMRETEQFRVTWQNVDWYNNVIRLKSSNTKAKRARIVPITSRLRPLLVEMFEQSDKRPTTQLFPFTTFRRSFTHACRDAGIDDLLWRDLRATGITWMLDAGVEEAKVMKIVGHSNYKTFLRYVRLSEELAQEAGEKIDRRRAELVKMGKFSAPK